MIVVSGRQPRTDATDLADNRRNGSGAALDPPDDLTDSEREVWKSFTSGRNDLADADRFLIRDLCKFHSLAWQHLTDGNVNDGMKYHDRFLRMAQLLDAGTITRRKSVPTRSSHQKSQPKLTPHDDPFDAAASHQGGTV